MSQSRIGKLPIKLPSNVEINQSNFNLEIKGKFGKLAIEIPNILNIDQQNDILKINVNTTDRKSRSLHGLYRSLIKNMVIGVSEQFTYTLKLIGVGYRATVQGKKLTLNLGYSHLVELKIPEDISVEVIQNTTLKLKGCDNRTLGLFAAKIRSWRPPEPYKGKGISYENEIIKRKAGKSGKK
uniref:Ribosomal protein L6 n=1 Tax=Toxarium undulatum TaxID=210620 RepID=A0A1D8D9N0_9STRA|nr:ribosomal protein L6 [Toxarium undulatum]AOS86660.1 ribosomal protein L6 [Toxarium undulatum]